MPRLLDRLLVAVPALALLGLGLAACSDGGGSTGPTAPPPPPPAAAGSASLGGQDAPALADQDLAG